MSMNGYGAHVPSAGNAGQTQSSPNIDWPKGPPLSTIWGELTEFERGYLTNRFERTSANGVSRNVSTAGEIPFLDMAMMYRYMDLTVEPSQTAQRLKTKMRPHLTDDMVDKRRAGMGGGTIVPNYPSAVVLNQRSTAQITKEPSKPERKATLAVLADILHTTLRNRGWK